MSSVRVTKYVACPFSASMEFAEHVLRARKDLTVSPAPAVAESVRLEMELTNDLTDEARGHDALVIAWQPRHVTLFPNFHGLLTARPKHRGATLRVQGFYEPPFGTFGRIFDAFIGRQIARLTLSRFLGELTASIEEHWNRVRQEIHA